MSRSEPGQARPTTTPGTLFEVDRLSLDGNDVTYGRGHIGEFRHAGRIMGRGRLASGVGVGGIIGTNTSITTGGSWSGDMFDWVFEDGFRHEGAGDIIIDSKALGSLTIGTIDSDGAVTTDFGATAAVTAAALAPAGPVIVHPRAVFRNRFNSGGYFPCIGDILVAADGTIGAHLSGHNFHMGAGTGTTVTLTLPAAVQGIEYTFQNGTSTASTELHLNPSAGQNFRDGATVGAADKNWQLTGLGATMTIKCFTNGLWNIVNTHGTQSIEP